MGMTTKKRIQVAGGSQLPQRRAQQFGLLWQGGIIEVQVDHVRSDGLLIHAQAGRQCYFPHKGPSAGLPYGQPHRLEFGVDTGGRNQRYFFLAGQLTVRGQAGAWRQFT